MLNAQDASKLYYLVAGITSDPDRAQALLAQTRRIEADGSTDDATESLFGKALRILDPIVQSTHTREALGNKALELCRRADPIAREVGNAIEWSLSTSGSSSYRHGLRASTAQRDVVEKVTRTAIDLLKGIG